jgi:hypothetical protein
MQNFYKIKNEFYNLSLLIKFNTYDMTDMEQKSNKSADGKPYPPFWIRLYFASKYNRNLHIETIECSTKEERQSIIGSLVMGNWQD